MVYTYLILLKFNDNKSQFYNFHTTLLLTKLIVMLNKYDEFTTKNSVGGFNTFINQHFIISVNRILNESLSYLSELCFYMFICQTSTQIPSDMVIMS